MEERICMNIKDLKRIEVSRAAKERRIKQAEAAGILRISPGQFRRVLRRFMAEKFMNNGHFFPTNTKRDK